MIKRESEIGLIDIDIDYEIEYKVSSGNSTIIPLNSKWNSVIIQISGGLDSAILTYLTAKSILDNKLDIKIRPYSVEVPSKVKSLSSSRNVVKKITELLDFHQWLPSEEFYMPLELSYPPNKDKQFFMFLSTILNDGESQFEFNGNTKNPPEHIRSTFKNDEYRQFSRDNRTTIYNGPRSASPHAMMDKKDIVELYVQHNVLDSLAPLTLSCDENADKIARKNLPIPCQQCWWCSERAWGLQANNITHIK